MYHVQFYIDDEIDFIEKVLDIKSHIIELYFKTCGRDTGSRD